MINFKIILTISFYFLTIQQNSVETYIWKQELPPGNGRFQENWTAGKFPMGITPVIGFAGKLYIVGNERTWISEDGINWTSYCKTDWGERYGMTITYFNNELWAMGGMKKWEKFFNDIWASSDGLEWHRVTQSAGWSERRGHAVVVHNNKMWLIGGSSSTGIPDRPPKKSLNDVWSTEDGKTWNLITGNAAWSEREPAALSLNGRLFVIGDTGKSDVWFTKDGATWELLRSECEWPARQNYGLLTFNNYIWLFGGRDRNDVWRSTDGQIWVEEPNANWSSRTTNHSVVYMDKIWVFSGKTGREDSWEGDIWSLQKMGE
jgi:hypothetical protein